MTATGTRGRGRPRDPEADAAILRAGLDLFLDRGLEGASIEQIAKRAGVGKLTVYRRWSSKEDLIAQAIEALVAAEVVWPSDDEIDRIPPGELVAAALENAAETASRPSFRALAARVYGSSVSHPLLFETYWRTYILPRRRLAARMLERAQAAGAVPADADLEVLIDMMAGAVTYRVLRPDPPDAAEMRRYLTEVYRRVGLLP